MKRLVIVTGPSGSGKTLALHSFEDAGYFASDNLPPALLHGLADFCCRAGFGRAAVVIDTRLGKAFEELEPTLQTLRDQGIPVELLFLDASDEALVRRFKETRRPPSDARRDNGRRYCRRHRAGTRPAPKRPRPR